MKIDNGPQMNCSELVARLYPMTQDKGKLHSWLKSIEEATEWNIGLEDIGEFRPTFDNITEEVKWNLRGAQGETKQVMKVIDIDDIIITSDSYNSTDIYYPLDALDDPILKEFFRKCNYRDKDIVTPNLVKTSSVEVRDKHTYPYGIRIMYHDGYCNSGLQLKTFGHGYEKHYPIIAECCDKLDGSWHTHDGGSAGPFQHWCKDNGYEKIAKRYNWV